MPILRSRGFKNLTGVFGWLTAQVTKANGAHKKNVWEIVWCPEYVLKCNKSVHLPAWVSFLCLLGDLWVIWARFALRDTQSARSANRAQITHKSPKRHNKDTQVVIAFQYIFGTSHNFPYILLMCAISLGYLCWQALGNGGGSGIKQDILCIVVGPSTCTDHAHIPFMRADHTDIYFRSDPWEPPKSGWNSKRGQFNKEKPKV